MGLLDSNLPLWGEQLRPHVDWLRLHSSSTAGKAVVAAVSLLLLALTALTTTYVYTNLRYRRHLARLSAAGPHQPPAIPYSIPFLGSALDFLAPRPGVFWRKLFEFHPRSTAACTLLLGGQHAHILFDQTAVATLFKTKGPSRQRFNVQLMRNLFELSDVEIQKLYGDVAVEAGDKVTIRSQDDIWNEFLIKTESVAELTSKFVEGLSDSLAADPAFDKGQTLETGICGWLRNHMFNASTLSLLGSKVFEVYPDIAEDYWAFDAAFLPLFYGLPKFLMRKEWAAMNKIQAGCRRWHEAADVTRPVDSRGPAWEPLLGSRVNRGRHTMFTQRNMEPHTKASLDLAMLFGINSNAIPSACWMIMNILDPKGDKTVLPRILAELESTQNADGTLDISKLVALPLLQSIFQESLRLYTDVLVTRDLPQDLVLPTHNGTSSMKFEKNSVIMAPSSLAQLNPDHWTTPEAPCDKFYAERFIKQDPTTGKDVFSMDNTIGRLFPFGGGKSICPGRVFAKQEVLGAVATVLLNFDFEAPQYVDVEGRPATSFPDVADGYGGGGVYWSKGDVRAKISRRSKA